MTVLTATAIVTAVDRASPVFARLAGRAQQAARVYGGVAQTIQQVGTSAAVNFAAPAVLGLTALIHRTQEFEKALVGVQIAQITDNIGAGGAVNFTRIRADAERIRLEALRISEALNLPPAGILRAGEAAAKMGLTADSLSALMSMGGAVNIQDQSVTPAQAAEFLGSMGILFRAGQTGDDYNADYVGDITRIANQMLYVANATRTSAGRMQEGLRIFAPLYASFGEDFATTTALVGAAVQAGQADIEMGTAFRSAGARFLGLTRQGRESTLLSGFRREEFMNLEAVSASTALNRLKSLTTVPVRREQWRQMQSLLVEGQNGRLFLDPAFQQRLMTLYNSITGARTQDSQDANADRMLMSILTGGGRIRMGAILERLADMYASGQLTETQLSEILEKRHLSRYLALFREMATMRRLRAAQRGLGSEVTDAGTALWRDSSAGRWEGALASLDRSLVSLRESGAVSGAINFIERFASALGAIPPGVAETIGSIGVGLVAIGVAGAALAGVSAFFSTIAAAAGGISVAAAAFVELGTATKWMLGVGGIALAFADWQAILKSITDVGPDGLSALGAVSASFGEMAGQVKAALSDITTFAGELTKLLGIEIDGSLFATGLRAIAGTIKAMAEGIKLIREDGAALLGGGSASDTRTGRGASAFLGVLDQQAGGFWSEFLGRVAEPLTGPRPPAIPDGGSPTFGLGPGGTLIGGGQVQVQGEAQVDMQQQVEVQLTPTGAFAGLIEAARAVVNGATRANVPLNTGQGMPDAGSGGGPPAVQIAPRNVF